MFRRSIRTKMPSLTPSVSDPEVRARDATSKQKGKEYADKRRKAAPRNFSPGDQVLLRQEKNNKLSTCFEHTPYTVVFQKGNSVVLRSSKGQVIQRNVAHMKRFVGTIHSADESDSDSDPDNVSDLDVQDIPEPLQDFPLVEDRPQRRRRPPRYLDDFVV